jgi:hypothetical protein
MIVNAYWSLGRWLSVAKGSRISGRGAGAASSNLITRDKFVLTTPTNLELFASGEESLRVPLVVLLILIPPFRTPTDHRTSVLSFPGPGGELSR